MSAPTITVLSLGAGVQSTTLALLAVEDALPRPDAAIFADTGWEPKAVYDHLDRLDAALTAAGIPLYRVSKGNLREDAINPDHRYASVPYYVLGPCTVCDATGRVDTLRINVGHFPERTVTRLRRWMRERGLAEHDAWTGPCPHCDGTGKSEGMGRRQCTSEYKLSPIRRKVRELLGAAPPEFRRVPKGQTAEQWVGFSTDEVHRANRRHDSVSYLSTRYPLLDLDMSRKDCERWLTARGWTTTKSACIGCPYHGNRQWRDLRDNHPDEWTDAVEFDAAIRKGGSRGLPLNGEAFLHRSRVPLDQAPIDRVTYREWQDQQVDLFDAIAEEGDPDGCSPYGCRSGEVVA